MIYAGGFAATAAMKENARVSQRLDSMAQDQNNLIWLDMEMTGLNP
jgi:hypothetical protein